MVMVEECGKKWEEEGEEAFVALVVAVSETAIRKADVRAGRLRMMHWPRKMQR